MKRSFLIDIITEGVKIDEDNQIISGLVGSTGALDRHGETINPKGWVLDNFMLNPVILFGHDYYSLPIGKAINVYQTGDKLKFDIQFAPSAMGIEVFNLLKEKYLNASSVGFLPIEWGKEGQKYTYMKQELLELSIVPVPANPEAVTYIRTNALEVAKVFDKTIDVNGEPKTVLAYFKQLVEEVGKADQTPKTPETPVDPEYPETPKLPLDPPTDTETPETPTNPETPAEGQATEPDQTTPEAKSETVTKGVEQKEDEIEEKSGRVLSSVNEKTLRTAYENIGKVLDQLDAQKETLSQPTDTEEKPAITTETETVTPAEKPEADSELIETLRTIQRHIKKSDRQNEAALRSLNQIFHTNETPENNNQGAGGGD